MLANLTSRASLVVLRRSGVVVTSSTNGALVRNFSTKSQGHEQKSSKQNFREEPQFQQTTVIPLLAGIVIGGAAAYFLDQNDEYKAKLLKALPLPHSYASVAKDIEALIDDPEYDDGSRGPLFVRLAWHCAGTYDKKSNTGGSNGATMRFRAESTHGANKGLYIARVALEPLKKKYPWISYADLYTLAGVVAIKELGGPSIPWHGGRTDAVDGSACPPDGRLPDASKAQQHVRDVFYRMGFNDQEIVALCGAHALGRCHTQRSGYSGPWTRAPTSFSNEYFRELVENKWTKKKWDGPEQYEDPSGELMMLPADLALIQDPAFKIHVANYAANQDVFFNDFSKAFQKLLELGVPFGANPPTYKP